MFKTRSRISASSRLNSMSLVSRFNRAILSFNLVSHRVGATARDRDALLLSVPTTKCLAPHLSAGRWAQPVINSSSHTGTTEHRVEPSPLRYCAVLTWRPAVDCTLVIALIALFIFVPWLRDHRSAIFAAYLAGLTVFVTIKVIRRRYSLE